MSTHNIPFSIIKKKITPNLQLWDFSKGPENKFETAMVLVNEPSVFKPMKFYCSYLHKLNNICQNSKLVL